MKQLERELIIAGYRDTQDEPQGLPPEENLVLALLSIPRKIGKNVMRHLSISTICINCGRMGETSMGKNPPIKILESFVELNPKVSRILQRVQSVRPRGRVVKGMVIRNGFCGRCAKQLKSKIPSHLKEKENGSTEEDVETVAMRTQGVRAVLPSLRRRREGEGEKGEGHSPRGCSRNPGSHDDPDQGDAEEKEKEEEEKVTPA